MGENQLEIFKRHAAKIDPFPRDNNVLSNKGQNLFKAKFEPYFFEDDIIIIPYYFLSLRRITLKKWSSEFTRRKTSNEGSRV